MVTLENGKLIQKMGEMCVEREILDEKLIVVRHFEFEEFTYEIQLEYGNILGH